MCSHCCSGQRSWGCSSPGTMIMCVDFQTSHDTKENDSDDDINDEDGSVVNRLQ